MGIIGVHKGLKDTLGYVISLFHWGFCDHMVLIDTIEGSSRNKFAFIINWCSLEYDIIISIMRIFGLPLILGIINTPGFN